MHFGTSQYPCWIHLSEVFDRVSGNIIWLCLTLDLHWRMVWCLSSGWDISYLDWGTRTYNCSGCFGELQSWKDICIRRSPSDIHILCGSRTAFGLLSLAVEEERIFRSDGGLCDKRIIYLWRSNTFPSYRIIFLMMQFWMRLHNLLIVI